MSRRELLLESFEERILCDATADTQPPVEVEPLPSEASQTLVEAEPLAPPPEEVSADVNASGGEAAAAVQDVVSEDQSSPASPDSGSDEVAVPQSVAPPVEVVFVDTSVPSYQTLLAGLNPEAEVILLRQDQDGLHQMAQALAGRTGIEAIHIISHGSQASLTLGSATLTIESMEGQYASILRTIGESLTEEGDLLVYGCNFGKDTDGLAAATTLAAITGADVAASTNNTGSASMGGDWVLEAQTGLITTAVAVDVTAQQQWTGLLAPAPVQFFYVPLPEQAMLASMQAINSGVNGGTGMDSIIVITATENNTIIYYDHWENGYEDILAVPTQTTGTARTQIWGDGDATNGATPGAAPGTDPAINAGQIITLRNTIPLPRNPANTFFDGGDKIGSTKTVSISRAQVPLPTGSVISSAVEVRDTRYYDTAYTAPVGVNTPRPGGVGTLFSDNFLYVMASQNNTTVQIDANNDGTFEQTVVLNEGQNVVSTLNVSQGGRVLADKPVQTNLYTGNDAASYATRSYSLLPNAQLTNDYFTPVGDTGDDVVLFVYNPNSVAITVSYETRTTSGNLPSVAAGATQFFVVPGNTGTRLYTASGLSFAALGAHDTSGDGSTHDWGFSLQPTASLSQFAVVGLGVGNSTSPPSSGGVNVSPIWVTPLAATTVYVDNDGDPNTGLFLDPITGTRYDQSFALARLQTQRVYDTTGGDNNQSGMRLFTNDGTLISTAWGEDTVAPTGSPGFDAGTTVPALPVPEFYKFVDFAPGGDANGDGYYNSGDTLRYTLRVRNLGTELINNATITDVLPTSYVTYVAGSTLIDQGSGAVAIADGGTTSFPLDEGGYIIPALPVGSTTNISFDVMVNGSLPSGVDSLYNIARLEYGIFKIPATNTASLRGTVEGTVYVDQDNDGDQDTGEQGIAGVTLTLTGIDLMGVAVSRTVTTDAFGRYIFTNLKESNATGYTVTQTQPTGFLDGLETRGGVVIAGSGGGPNVVTNIVVQPGELDRNNNFGELGGTLSGFVYGDLSNFGVKDAFESGIGGVTVTLTGTDTNGDAVNLTTTSAAGTGAYSFTGLRASNASGYTITEVATPPGYADGLDTIGSQGGTTGDDVLSAIVLASGATGTNNNFGETPVFNLTKSLETTNVTGTTGSNLSVGEIATFRLVATIPAGSFTNFQIQDALPPGFQFIDGSALVGFVGGVTGGIAAPIATTGSPLTVALPDLFVSNNSTTDDDAYASGSDVFFKLGTIVNTDTNGATTEAVVIEFQAIVLNVAGNQAAATLPNTFSVLFDKDGVPATVESHGSSSNTVTSTIVEPVLGVAKTLAVSGTDAGDAVQYTITITNAAANNATAYDINVLDALDSDILLNDVTLGSGIVVSGATVSANTSTTSNLNLVLSSLAAGSSVTITLNATVAATASAGSTVANSTNVSWTSTPGANADERDGGGGINDYAGSATSADFVLARPTVDKLTPSDTTYSVGETVIYDILVTLPEGVTTGLAITDNLPAGLDFVSVVVQTAAGGALANAFNGTVPAPITSNVGNSYTFAFGNTTAANDNIGTNNSFLVRVTARVANVAGNQNAVTLTNTATLAYTDGTNGASTVNDPTPNVDVAIVEPVLTLDKTTIGITTGLDAGDTVQYSITITNTGTATAHEVVLSDALPGGLLVTTIDSTTPSAGASIDTATGGVGTATLTGEYTIPVGESITIIYTATLQSSVTPNTNYLNTATVAYSSVDGTALGQGTATGERTGSGGVNDYALTDTATVSTGGVLTVAKGVDNSTPSIGDVLTYTVTLTLNEGTTNGIIVTDTLPASGDLQFVAGSAAVSFGTAGSSISGSTIPVITGANGNVLTFSLGSAVVPTGAGANTVVLTYQVLVRNVATNQAGDVEANNANVVATDLITPPDSTTSVTLREPNVTFTKNADVTTNVDAGDVITYTVTLTNPGGANASTAFDALLVDTLPANLLVTGITSTTLAGGATVDSAATITGGGAGLTGQYDIPVGATVTIVYTATVQAGFPPNGSITNNAVLTWTSTNGGNSTAPDANERFGDAGSTFGDGSLNDYRRTTEVTSTGFGPTFSKVFFASSETATADPLVAIGEQVTYALVVTLPEGTATGLVLTDNIPAGMQYVSTSLVTTVAASGGLLTADFAGSVPTPTVTGGASSGDDATLTFGAITVTGDNVSGNNSFIALVTMRVLDESGNSGINPPGQTTLGNVATLNIPLNPPVNTPPVDVTVVEPRLQISKVVDDAAADLGQTLNYTLTIQHTGASTATAFDLLVREALPTGLTLIPASINVTSTSGNVAITANASTTTSISLDLNSLALGDVVTITYSATVGTSAALTGTNIDNNARLYWDTTAADEANAILTNTPDGTGDRDFGATDGYVEDPSPSPNDLAQDTERVAVNSNLISGFVYIDADGNGVFGVESGVDGVTITLTGTDLNGNTVNQSILSGGDGSFAFTNLAAGTYTLTQTQPASLTDALENVGTLFGGTTSDAFGSNVISNIVIPTGSAQSAVNYNFGEVRPSSVLGTVYIDANNDGILAGETGIPNITMTLSGTDIYGQVVLLTTTTDANGNYTFDNGGAGLRQSDATGYTITQGAVPAPYLDGRETAGSLSGNTAANDVISGIVLPQNTPATGYIFGELAPASLSGSVYADLDNDGAFDTFESGVPGVTVTLTGNDDRGNAVNVTVTTNAAGGYSFANLRPSSGAGYTITETQPADFSDGTDTIGTPGGTANNDSFSAVILAAGVNGANNNFGEQPTFALSKSLVNTSEAGTTGNNVAIGEVATFRLVVTVPAGSLTNFQVRDLLPSGYQYVDGSARVGLVGALTSSTITAPLGSITTPTVVLPDAAVSDNALTNSDSYASGTDVFFKLGDLTNTDTTAAVEAIVIEFDAVVVNEAANVAGTPLTNSFSILYERNGLPNPDPDPNPVPPSVTTTVVAPVLTFAKNASPTGAVGAGDPITYTLTITNPGGANSSMAFDALVNDVMPADILITSITGTTLAGGATTDSAAAITGGGTGLTGQYDIPVGGSVTITYVGTVQISAAPGSTQINNAALTWTSINGNNSLTPDSGERYGAAGTLYGDANLNNLRRIASQTVTVGTASFGKNLFSTSDAGTTGSNVAIGETVTYALTVTVPAGTAPSLSVVDTLPPGLQFVSSSIQTTAAGSNGLLTADFNGTVPAPTVSGGVVDGDDVTFNFASIVAAADGNSTNNTFLILVTARVTDIAGNEGILPGQTTLDNTATFEIPGDGVPPTTPPPVTVTVVEPVLTIDKEFNVTQADAGDTVQVSITVGNTGTGPVYDVSITDVVDLTKFGSITEVTTPSGFTFNNTLGTVNFTGGSIAAGGSVTFVFSVVLRDSVNPSEVLSNTSSATGTSQSGVVTGERTFGPVQDTDTLTVPAVFSLTKDIASPTGGTVKIGDVVTYQVTVTVVEGTTQNISLSDTLPTGMTYVASSAVVSNANGMTVNGFAAGAAGQLLTMTATSVVNPGNVDNTTTTDSDTFTITYQAVVNDVAGNTAGTLLTNSLTGGGTGVPPSNPPPVTTTVTEPQLKVTKAADDGTPDLGQTVHFTLTIQNLAVANGATAFDILVRDALPSGLTGLTNIVVSGAVIDSNTSTGTLLDLKLAQLVLGATATVEFDAVVSSAAAFAGASIDNNARIYWDSQAGESANSVLTGAADGDGDRDYGATGGDEVFNLDPQDAQDTERLVVNGNTISGVVYQDADASGTLNGAETGLGVGVQVTISGKTFFGEDFTQTVTANATTGIYTFSNVPRSDATGYTITEVQPVSFVDGVETAGTPFGGTTNNALNADNITAVVVPVGANTGTGYNFGELLPTSLAGSVYNDTNNDGARQGGETGVNAVPVRLTGTDAFGQAVSIDGATNTTGDFIFNNGGTGLRPGTYTLTELTQPAGLLDGKETAGTSLGDATATNEQISAISLAQNTAATGYLFGELRPVSLSGFVYADLDGDGAKDAGESGLAGVTVRLTGTDDLGQPVDTTVLTDATGAYSFTNLRPGTYSITETQPAGYADGADTLGTGLSAPNNAGTVGADTFTGIQFLSVAAGNDAGTGYNFGEAPLFNPTKSLVSTSSTSTTGTNVAIGETARFRLVVNVPQGSLANFQIQDALPPGYAYVNGSARAGIVSSAGQLTSTLLTAPLTDINATPIVALADASVSTDPAANDDTYASGTDIYFKFGTLTNTDTNGATVEGIVIEFDAIVVNEAAVQSGSSLANSFNVLYDRDGNGTPDTNPTPSNTVTTTVVEPVLAIAKTISTAVSQVEAGDTVTYQITVQHTGASNADAFDLSLSDTIPAELENVTLDSAVIGATNVASALNLTGNSLTTTGNIDLLQGQTLVITISGQVRNSVAPATVISNSATTTYTSLDGTVTGERDGSGGVNDYTSTASAPDITTVGTLQVAKTANKATATLGETVTYTVTVTVGEGTTNNLALNDTLPAGMQFVSGSAVIAANPAGMTITGFNANSVDQTLTVVNPGNVDNAAGLDSDTFTITYQAIVLDVVGNQDGTTLVNDLDASADNLPPDVDNQVTVTVTEPELSVTKTAGVATANIGDTISYTLIVSHTAASTSGAFDVLVRDAIPAGFTLNLASISVTGATLETDSSTTSQLDLKLTALALNSTATITFTVTIAADPALVGTAIDNNARVYWDSQAGEGTNTVLVGGNDGDEDRDYGATGPDEVFNANTQDAQDTERVMINANTITGFAYQDVNADGDYDAGTDALLDGVQITLTGTLAAGGAPFTATATSVAGVYVFNNLPAGTFTLTETQPTGYVDGAETAGTPFGGSVSAVLDSNTITGVVIPSGSNSGASYNFGEVLGSSIAGSVFDDTDNDGARAGEPGIGGVSVRLTGTDFLGQTVNLQGTTLADGSFTFGSGETLRPGTYTLTELTQPAGFLDGKDTAGPTGGDATSVNDVISGIVLPQGTPAADNVFGELQPSSISGFVFVDNNGDGIKDPTEQGIPGVTVQLTGTDDLGNPVAITVTSGADGGYTFSNLRPGNYTLTETQPADYTDGPEYLGNAGGNLGTNDVIANIVLTPGTTATGYNFVEVPILPTIPPPQPPVESRPPLDPVPQPEPFVFAFDTFRNFANSTPPGPIPPGVSPIDIWGPAMLPLAPIYSGAANPGATLVIDLYNANGVHIGSQTVIADSGGNWLANFTSVVLRDAPSEVRITQMNAPYSFGSGSGHNLRTYYAPAALNPGHFLGQTIMGGHDDEPAPLLQGLDLANPIALGPVKYGGEFLAAEGVASSN